jgi:hypothetical protein
MVANHVSKSNFRSRGYNYQAGSSQSEDAEGKETKLHRALLLKHKVQTSLVKLTGNVYLLAEASISACHPEISPKL